jgi:hypothetical protein
MALQACLGLSEGMLVMKGRGAKWQMGLGSEVLDGRYDANFVGSVD